MNFLDRVKNVMTSAKDGIVKHKKVVIICVAAALVIALFFTALYFTGVYDDRANAIVELEAPTIQTEVLDNGGFGSGISVVIRGKIRNNIHTTVKYVAFRFELYDANGTLVTMPNGEPFYAVDSAQNLYGGMEFEYAAVVLVPLSTPTPLTFKPAKSNLGKE